MRDELKQNAQGALQTRSLGTKLVTLRVGVESFLVPLPRVVEVLRLPYLNIVPLAPEHCAGVVAYKGGLLSVINLDCFLNSPDNSSKGIFLAVLKVKKEHIAVLVDEVGEVLVEMANKPEKTTISGLEKLEKIIDGQLKIEKNRYFLLNCEKLLEFKE